MSANMTKEQILAMLADIRAQELAEKEAQKSMPLFAYVVVLATGKIVYWSGKAKDQETAEQAAKEYAEQEGQEFFAMCPRPLPQPRGRKAASAPLDTLADFPKDQLESPSSDAESDASETV